MLMIRHLTTVHETAIPPSSTTPTRMWGVSISIASRATSQASDRKGIKHTVSRPSETVPTNLDSVMIGNRIFATGSDVLVELC